MSVKCAFQRFHRAKSLTDLNDWILSFVHRSLHDFLYQAGSLRAKLSYNQTLYNKSNLRTKIHTSQEYYYYSLDQTVNCRYQTDLNWRSRLYKRTYQKSASLGGTTAPQSEPSFPFYCRLAAGLLPRRLSDGGVKFACSRYCLTQAAQAYDERRFWVTNKCNERNVKLWLSELLIPALDDTWLMFLGQTDFKVELFFVELSTCCLAPRAKPKLFKRVMEFLSL